MIGVTPSTAECDGGVTANIAPATLYVAELAQNLARSQTSAPAEPVLPARIWFPYRSGFNRAIRLVGMAMLLGSALGLPLRPLTQRSTPLSPAARVGLAAGAGAIALLGARWLVRRRRG